MRSLSATAWFAFAGLYAMGIGDPRVSRSVYGPLLTDGSIDRDSWARPRGRVVPYEDTIGVIYEESITTEYELRKRSPLYIRHPIGGVCNEIFFVFHIVPSKEPPGGGGDDLVTLEELCGGLSKLDSVLADHALAPYIRPDVARNPVVWYAQLCVLSDVLHRCGLFVL